MLIKNIFSSLSTKEIESPVFILGCGRSGTTIFGTTLSKHNSITYLNERRDLWFKAYPVTDIWTHKANSRNGKMSLTSDDIDNAKSLMLRRLFHRETIKTSKPLLVEKLPINNFRLEFIHAIFPDARFIHIYRNGLEVARSIQKASEAGGWFGSNEYKWKQLSDYSRNTNVTEELPDLCESYYHKGLLEWRLSTESAVGFLSKLQDDKYMEISYAQFSNEPVNTIEKVLDYLKISNDSNVIDFVNNNVSRKTSSLDNSALTEIESKLGGNLLSLSIDSTINGLINGLARSK